MKRLNQLWCGGAVACLLLCASAARGQAPAGQWDFNAGNLDASVGGAALQFAEGPGGPTEAGTAYGTTTTFGIPNIDGAVANVLRFAAHTNNGGYYMNTPSVPNGGGALVNEWTLVMDVLYPTNSMNLVRPIADVDGGIISAQPEVVVSAGNGLGVGGGSSFGILASNTWHRIGVVVDTNNVTFYVNGARVGSVASSLDGRFSMSPGATALLLGTLGGEAALGYVNSIQFRDIALNRGQMMALGGPAAAGIPQTIPPVPSYLEKWTPAGALASRTTPLGIVINRGDSTIPTESVVLKLNGAAVASPTVTQSGSILTVSKTGLAPLALNATNTLEVTFNDSQAGLKTFSKQFTSVLFFEDFEGLALIDAVEEPNMMKNAWTPAPPTGWVTNHSGMPGYGDPATDGRTEWAGWTFALKDFWLASDMQTREQFTKAQGTLAIADPDEWDDADHPETDDQGNALYFNSFLSTPPINVSGLPVSTLYVRFDSSWRPEGFDDWGGTNNQTGTVTVSYNGATPIEILRWDSQSGGPFFHPDSQNETVYLPLTNAPAGATNVVLRFGLTLGGNDWWWAFDNLEVNSGSVAPSISAAPVAQSVPTGSDAQFTVVASGTEPLAYQWYFNGAPLGTGTTPTLTLASVQAGQAGEYFVTVVNAAGSVTSAPVTLTVTAADPQRVTGQWDFNNGDLRPTVGAWLTNFNATVGTDTQFGTSTSFGIANIGGTDAKVLFYSPSGGAWGGYIMPHGAPANGNGAFVNRYSIVYDLYYPASSDNAWRALLQTSSGNANDGDLFINGGNGIGISGSYQGPVLPDVWNRIVATFDLTTGTLKKYLNGVLLGTQNLGTGTTDGRWSLDPVALLFADEDGETSPGYVNSIQFRNYTMTDAEVAALGGVTTDGIPGMVTRPNITSIAREGNSVRISWAGAPGLKLQQNTTPTATGWTDVPNSTGVSTITVPATGNAGFFRLAQ